MTPDHTTNLQLSPTDAGVASNWTTETGDLHFHGHRFDDEFVDRLVDIADHHSACDDVAREIHSDW